MLSCSINLNQHQQSPSSQNVTTKTLLERKMSGCGESDLKQRFDQVDKGGSSRHDINDIFDPPENIYEEMYDGDIVKEVLEKKRPSLMDQAPEEIGHLNDDGSEDNDSFFFPSTATRLGGPSDVLVPTAVPILPSSSSSSYSRHVKDRSAATTLDIRQDICRLWDKAVRELDQEEKLVKFMEEKEELKSKRDSVEEAPIVNASTLLKSFDPCLDLQGDEKKTAEYDRSSVSSDSSDTPTSSYDFSSTVDIGEPHFVEQNVDAIIRNPAVHHKLPSYENVFIPPGDEDDIDSTKNGPAPETPSGSFSGQPFADQVFLGSAVDPHHRSCNSPSTAGINRHKSNKSASAVKNFVYNKILLQNQKIFSSNSSMRTIFNSGGEGGMSRRQKFRQNRCQTVGGGSLTGLGPVSLASDIISSTSQSSGLINTHVNKLNILSNDQLFVCVKEHQVEKFHTKIERFLLNTRENLHEIASQSDLICKIEISESAVSLDGANKHLPSSIPLTDLLTVNIHETVLIVATTKDEEVESSSSALNHVGTSTESISNENSLLLYCFDMHFVQEYASSSYSNPFHSTSMNVHKRRRRVVQLATLREGDRQTWLDHLIAHWFVKRHQQQNSLGSSVELRSFLGLSLSDSGSQSSTTLRMFVFGTLDSMKLTCVGQWSGSCWLCLRESHQLSYFATCSPSQTSNQVFITDVLDLKKVKKITLIEDENANLDPNRKKNDCHNKILLIDAIDQSIYIRSKHPKDLEFWFNLLTSHQMMSSSSQSSEIMATGRSNNNSIRKLGDESSQTSAFKSVKVNVNAAGSVLLLRPKKEKLVRKCSKLFIVLEDQLMTKDSIPVFVDSCIKFVSRHGMFSEGIYRHSGVKRRIELLLKQFNLHSNSNNGGIGLLTTSSTTANGPTPDNLTPSIDRNTFSEHDVATALKRYVRSLSDGPLLKDVLHVEDSTSHNQRGHDRVRRYKEYLSSMKSSSSIHYHILRRIIIHLASVASQSDVNKMCITNLASIWGPSLILDSNLMKNAKALMRASELCCFVITNFESLFDVTKVESDREREILEKTKRFFNNPMPVKLTDHMIMFVHDQRQGVSNDSSNQSSNIASVPITPKMTASSLLEEAISKFDESVSIDSNIKSCNHPVLYETITESMFRRIVNSENIFDVILKWWRLPPSMARNTKLVVKNDDTSVFERALLPQNTVGLDQNLDPPPIASDPITLISLDSNARGVVAKQCWLVFKNAKILVYDELLLKKKSSPAANRRLKSRDEGILGNQGDLDDEEGGEVENFYLSWNIEDIIWYVGMPPLDKGDVKRGAYRSKAEKIAGRKLLEPFIERNEKHVTNVALTVMVNKLDTSVSGGVTDSSSTVNTTSVKNESDLGFFGTSVIFQNEKTLCKWIRCLWFCSGLNRNGNDMSAGKESKLVDIN